MLFFILVLTCFDYDYCKRYRALASAVAVHRRPRGGERGGGWRSWGWAWAWGVGRRSSAEKSERMPTGAYSRALKPFPEGPYIQLLGNYAPKYHTIEGIMGPNFLMVVYVDPLGLEVLEFCCCSVGLDWASLQGAKYLYCYLCSVRINK